MAIKNITEEVDALRLDNDRLRDALILAADRFDDMADIGKETGYSNYGFMKASARRCRNVLQGGSFNG